MAKGNSTEKQDEGVSQFDPNVVQTGGGSGGDDSKGAADQSGSGVDRGGASAMSESQSRQAALLVSRVSELESQLAQANSRLEAQEAAQRVEAALVRSGAIDLETALLLVEREMADSPDLGVEAAVASVRQRKPFLFGAVASSAAVGSGQSLAGGGVSADERLAGLADAALQSGDRGDVLRYLRARRS